VSLPGVLRALDGIGYAGLIGLEYRPRARTEEGFGWMRGLAI
jgi:hydroxypyruvate isomerase